MKPDRRDPCSKALSLRNHLVGAVLLGTAAIIGPTSAVHANSLTISPVTGTTDVFDTETGQSIPTGTAGFVDGTLNVTNAGWYLFTYGPAGLVPGATGHGNSTLVNEFWVGASLADAALAGHVFCTQSGNGCGGNASVVGDSFAVNLLPGPVPFGFTFGGNTITNGTTSTAGAYLDQIGLGGIANAGPGLIAYLGLSDGPYPTGDPDFQDLTVSVSGTPLPAALPLFTTGLGALGAFGWWRKKKKVATLAA